MIGQDFDGLPRIDNSQLVREIDPRVRRSFWIHLLLVCALIAGLTLYAWPHFEARRVGLTTVELHRERERLIEANRKLRLEKASLESLMRIETIASRELGMKPPAPERVVVVEPAAAGDNTSVAYEPAAAKTERH
ncbi:MAG: cell division protein FtsL [Vicinamibacteria bacterium]|jgi:cell division protein FtsL|nr:cell division protein FtsL [Vicinamibacteria bacterium]